MKAVRKGSKKNNLGFTMMELIVAIGILGVISATVTFVMITSSKTYRNMSAEAQLQSEAQLVANAISELAIDSFEATNKLEGLTLEEGFNNGDGEVLLLNSKAEGTTKQYVLALKASKKELYLAERTYDEASASWGALSEFSLLGDNINSFTVDDSRVEEDNVLLFELNYIKDGKSYKGNYQILMRNKAYADEVQQGNEDNTSTTLVLGLNPKIVYLDVINGKILSYYINSVSIANKRSAQMGVEFTSTATSNRSLENRGVSWDIVGEDEAIFKMSNGVNQEGENQIAKNTLKWNTTETYSVADSPIESFSIVIDKTIDNPDGEGVISAQKKTALVMLRRVRAITVNASGGVTQWNNRYTDEFGGIESPEAAGYAYVDRDGEYVDMTVNASIQQSNVAFGGGLTWTLEKRDDAGNWGPCSENFAQLLTTESDTSTSTQIKFGPALENGQLYKVTATSKFDTSVSGEYIFGVAPTGAGSDSGFHSRGFYVDMTSYVKTLSGYEKVSVAKMRKGTVSGIFGDGSDVRLEKGSDGRWYLYVSYDAYSGTGAGKSKFYSDTGEIQIHITRTDNTAEDDAVIKYEVSPVVVSKTTPQNEVLVLQKGKDESVTVQTSYYNVINKNYFGVYLNDMEKNINTTGLADSDKYISTLVTSGYGDAHNYIDRVTTRLTAKAANRDYNPNPVKLRLTADDYYVTSGQADDKAYTDYTVYIANVKDTEVFIPTPDTNTGVCTWPENVGSNKAAVNVYDANGNLIVNAAQVYVQGNSYKCDYMSSTYTYNKTYHYWNK